MQNTAARLACSWAMGLSLSVQTSAASATERSPCSPPRLALGPTRPNPNYSHPWHPARRQNRLGTCSPWRLLERSGEGGNAPDCCCLRCNWACKNIKARIAWHVMKWERQRAERKRRLTKHPTSNRKMRGRKGEKIKQQWEKKTKASFHETCRDRRSGSVLALGLRSLL